MKQGAHLLLVIQAIFTTYPLSRVITPWSTSSPVDHLSTHQSNNHMHETRSSNSSHATSEYLGARIEPEEDAEETLHRMPRPKVKRKLQQGHVVTKDWRQASVRSRRSTSKVTGLVVGACADAVLKAKVKDKLNDIEASLWNLQSQITKPFGGQDPLPGTVLGTFPSNVRTNFHGSPAASSLRQSQIVTDTNSLSTLLVLHCLTETGVYGVSKVNSASNMSIAVQALESYHSRTFGRGSSILTLWQEKVLSGAQGWVNFPENIAKTKVKDNTTYNQLQALAKSCDCEPAKAGFKDISNNLLCKDYFNTPFSDVIYDVATPPDFMTSFLNLALGGLLLSNTHAKTDLKLWQTINNDVTRLVAKLKDLVIVYPTTRSKSDSRSAHATAVNITLAVDITSAVNITVAETINSSGTSTAFNVGHGISAESAISPHTPTVSNISSNIPATSTISSIVPTTSNVGPVNPSEAVRNDTSNQMSPSGLHANRLPADLNPEECTSCSNVSVTRSGKRENGDYSEMTSADNTATASTPNGGQVSTVGSQILATLESTAGPSAASKSSAPPTLSSKSSVMPTLATTSDVIPSLKPVSDDKPSPTNISLTTTADAPSMTPPVDPTLAPNNAPKPAGIVSSKETSTKNPTTVKVSGPSGSQLVSRTHPLVNTTAPPVNGSAPHADAGAGHPSTSRKTPTIDSVSYFGLRRYLDDAVDDGVDVTLIPLWISDDADVSSDVISPGEVHHNGQMFHQYNSVDLTTTATVLHGLVLAATTGLVDIKNDDQLQSIVTSSLRMLTWYMTHPHDLATFVTLSSFPSKSMMYWSVSRVAFQLSSEAATRLFNFTGNVLSSFVTSLRKEMTYDILQSIVDGGLGPDGVTRVFIDDFIGVADLDSKGAKRVSGDDRLFTSAMAANSLLATWTVQGKEGSLKFIESTDDSVKIAVNGLVNYVFTALGDSTTPYENAYRSEQVKNCKTLPAWFPSNTITTRDGKSINVTSPVNTLRFGVKGHVPKDVYEKELAEPLFGNKAEVGPDSLNGPTSVFRFWTSHGLTKSACMLAIAQAANLIVDGAG
ncbi:unnamed protein product [Lymnaea stagnalis]|uniref:Uncharacterized protein n=1 Tax=Lymnaea stagnalis TaxID=6523 RepID=A0AAV2HCN2_LYMST